MKVIFVLAFVLACEALPVVPKAVDWSALEGKLGEIDQLVDDVTWNTVNVASKYPEVAKVVIPMVTSWQNQDKILLGKLLGRIQAEDLTSSEASNQYIQLLTRNFALTYQTISNAIWGKYTQEIYDEVVAAINFTPYSKLAAEFFDILEERAINSVDWTALANKVGEIDQLVEDVTRNTVIVASKYEDVARVVIPTVTMWQREDKILLGKLLGRIQAQNLTPLEASSQYIQLLTQNFRLEYQSVSNAMWDHFPKEIYNEVMATINFTPYSKLAGEFFAILEERS